MLAVLVAVVVEWGAVDTAFLLDAGRLTLTSHGLHTYAENQWLQTGPLSLPVFGVISFAGPAAGIVVRLLIAATAAGALLAAAREAEPQGTYPATPDRPGSTGPRPPWWLVPVVALVPALSFHMPPIDAEMVLVWVALAVALAVYAFARRRLGRTPPTIRLTRMQWFVLLLAAPWASLAAGTGHLEDALAVGCLTAAVLAQRGDRSIRAAALVGLAIAFKPWAAVGLAIPLCAGTGSLPSRARAAAVALAIPALSFLPFVIADPHTLHAFAAAFPVSASAPVRLLGLAPNAASPGWLRSAELGGALLVAAVTTRRRGAADGVAAGLLTRLLLDPSTYAYYASSAALAMVVADLLAGRKGGRSAAVLGYWLASQVVTGGWFLAALQAAWLLTLIGSLLARPASRPLPRMTPRPAPAPAHGVAGCFAGQPDSMSLQVFTRPVAGSVSRYSE